MKKFWWLPLLFIVGCTGGTPEAKTDTSSDSASKSAAFKVALITPGPISDAGWSAMAYDGLQAVKSELGAEVNNQEATGTKIRDAMRAYAQDGYQLVFGHGFEYNEPGVELAAQFPNTVFLSSSGGKTAANAGTFRFYLEQGFYLAGMAAADLSKTGKLAMVGLNIPSINSTFKAFEAGAKAAKPGISVVTITIDDGSDVAAAKQATLQALSGGVDLVIHQANAAAQGVFDACKEKGAWAFGANSDQNSNPSGAVIGSAVIVAKPAFVAVAKQVKEKTYKGSVTLMGMEQSAIDFIWNPTTLANVPQAVQDKIAEAKKKILAGELTVPKDEF